ncbi:MAG: hypothetical protein K2V38_13690, partial [Gemmataceae bacterium]|nr:hypothetical protein [Gemmataceae bacterium]
MRLSLLFVTLAAVGCRPGAEPPPAPKVPPMTSEPPPSTKVLPMTPDSAHNWGYFFPDGDRAAVVERLGGKTPAVSEYTVDKVHVVTGTPGVTVRPGAKLMRVEVTARLDAAPGSPTPLFQGVPRHLDYTTRAQKEALAVSRPPLAGGVDTVAVLIPIRKTAAWWALPHDDRQAHFRDRDGKPGHTAIGLGYTDRV